MAKTIAGKQDPWLANKKKAMVSAKKASFDAERILFFGQPLAEAVVYAAERVIEFREQTDGTLLESHCTLLELISQSISDDLTVLFQDGNDPHGTTDDCRRLVLSYLYLFPKLWKATDKRHSLDELKALDFRELVSERRTVQLRKPKRRCIH